MDKEATEELINLASQAAVKNIPFIEAIALVSKFMRDSAKEVIDKLSDEEKEEFLKNLTEENG